jgi:hypothetical protein
MLGKIRYIRKSRIAFADILPILGRNLVTRVAGQLLVDCMSGVGKLCVIDFRHWWRFGFLRSPALRPSLPGSAVDVSGRECNNDCHRRDEHKRH